MKAQIISGFKYWLNQDGLVTLAKSIKTGRFVSPAIIQRMLDYKAIKMKANKHMFNLNTFFLVFSFIFFVGFCYAATRHHISLQSDVHLMHQMIGYMLCSLVGALLTHVEGE